MTATVNKVTTGRLLRGSRVMVAETHSKLAGKTLVVTSKGLVKCNGKGRCAGEWCIGKAVFVASASTAKKDKEMGWRGGSTKICLTHLQDTDGEPILAPPLLMQTLVDDELPTRRLAEAVERGGGRGREIAHPIDATAEVSWDDLAHAAQVGDLNAVVGYARALKTQNEALKTQVIEAQRKLLDHLTS